MGIQTVIFNKVSFSNVVNPHELEIKDLKNNFGFNPLHIEDYIHRTQTPKIEKSKNYHLIVLDIPSFNQNGVHTSINSVHNATNGGKKTNKSPIDSLLSISHATLSSVPIPHFSPHEKKMRIVSNQVDFFIGKDYLVVLHSGASTPIDHIFSLCQKTLRHRNEFMGQGPVYLAYRIIDALVDTCFPVINKLSAMIDQIDKELEDGQSQETIEDISVTRRNIVVLHTMIKPIIPLFRHLKEGGHEELNGNMQTYWGNVLDHLQKIWDRIEDNRELIEGISASNESLLSFRNNEIIKFFTVITSIAFPFVIVNNLYSMNVSGLPYAQQPWIVWVLFGVIFIAGIGVIVYFKLRRWI